MIKWTFFLLMITTNLCLGQSGNNTIQGQILLPDFSPALFQRGKSYRGPNPNRSAEKTRLDGLNVPSRNIYISLHPKSFQPKLIQKDARITQREKTFFPNIVAITAESTVYLLNEDEHYHNIYSLTPKARFNIGRRPPGNVYAKKISKVGVVKLGCDIHPEMGAVILSLDTPYFTKIKADGTYNISGLPDGEYELRVYHPSFRTHREPVILERGKVTTKDINLKNKA